MMIFRISVIYIAAVFLCGCATLTKGTDQAVSIDTPGVPGATCVLNSEGIGTRTIATPQVVILPKSQHSISVKCSKACFTDGVGVISSNTEAMAVGNLIVGGVVGLGVDAVSGAMNKYTPQVQIAMQPVPSCSPSKKR